MTSQNRGAPRGAYEALLVRIYIREGWSDFNKMGTTLNHDITTKLNLSVPQSISRTSGEKQFVWRTIAVNNDIDSLPSAGDILLK
ncbi:hypothetical protein Cflav_PD0836 [Pedosphaera parvula Ellin514]|uniref:Uncharacterized protein n=1 Tax=Pedosphaera parvula (strain Ellin514) TaxID=320771 RepID=B9XQG1_PEDPL|nr:hypothetical protein Cflav_PD0836 [Pedosphaera parvula Ellin514]